MEFSVKSGNPEKQRSACIVVGVFEPRRLSGVAEQLDKVSDGYLSNLLRRGDLEGKSGQVLLLHHVPNILAERVLLVGCGKERELDERQYRQIIARTMNTLNETGSMEAVCFLSELHVKGRDTYWKVRQAVEAARATLYNFNELKSKKEEPRRPLRKLVFNVPSRKELALGEQAVQHALAVATGMDICRNVANMPPNICTPRYLADQAKLMAENYDNLTVSTVEEAEMEKLGMNAYLAVGRGSEHESVLTLMHYKGAPDDQPPIVLVGKGLTFDSGGISIKPSANMDEMKYDMGGSASVFGAIQVLAETQPKINVVAVIAAAENMPDGNASRPGDIVTTMSGQTVEILNTDAEGRLVLCDALTYVKKFDPEVVIDLATLTGACIIALGHETTGLMANNDDLANELLAAGERASDKAWRLPIWDEYQSLLDSNFADMANIGGRTAGTITAACFLARFTKEYRWAHLDIAGTAWHSGKAKGSSGRPVPLLVDYLMSHAGQ
jgi:leucyl aminopeptidase